MDELHPHLMPYAPTVGDAHEEFEALRCTVCFEYPQLGGHFIKTTRGGVCGDCITTMVQRVVDDLDPYPAKLDHRAIDPQYLTDVFSNPQYLTFSNDLIERYKEKKIEHETFPAQRVYCSCGKFVNHLRTVQPGEEIITIAPCKKPDCGLWVCLLCASPLDAADLLDSIMNHDCRAKREAKNEDMNKMLQSEERGENFQVCPNCDRIIQLSEACNHMTCHCGADFCYACGERVSDSGRHWGPGMRCPRWPRRNILGTHANDGNLAAQAAEAAAAHIAEQLAAQGRRPIAGYEELARRANNYQLTPPRQFFTGGLPAREENIRGARALRENDEVMEEEEDEDEDEDDDDEFEHFDDPPHDHDMQFDAPIFRNRLTGRGAGTAAGERERTEAEGQRHRAAPRRRADEFIVQQRQVAQGTQQMQEILPPARPGYRHHHRFAVPHPPNVMDRPPQREEDAPAEEDSPGGEYWRMRLD